MSRKYLKLIEKCAETQEVYVHYMRVDDNEEAVKALKKLIDKFGKAIKYSYGRELKSETLVNKQCDLNKGRFMKSHAKNDCLQSAKTFNEIISQEEFNELFYRGGIRSFGLDWYKYPKQYTRD